MLAVPWKQARLKVIITCTGTLDLYITFHPTHNAKLDELKIAAYDEQLRI